MHTFELSYNISLASYQYLHNNLPFLNKVSNYVERTNYYSAKGITQIELRTHEYFDNGRMVKKHYLIIRCNLSVIVDKNKIFLLNLKKYSPDKIRKSLVKRIYEINEFRYIKLDKLPIEQFKTNRVDIAKDIQNDFPEIILWLCNMSFPFGYKKMKRKVIYKDIDQLNIESCYFGNASRTINIYSKFMSLINTRKMIPTENFKQIQKMIRFEVQIKKRGIYSLKLPTKRLLLPFLKNDFCDEYIKKEVKSLFGVEKYVSRSEAVKLINSSNYKPYDKAVMLSIVDMIHQFKGLYELEKAIADKNIFTPCQYGNIRVFKEKWLKKFKALGIQPIVIPDNVGIDTLPSIYNLLDKESEN